MKKLLMSLGIVMVCTAGSAFAATPEATYNALLDSYANMSILNAPQFPVQGSKGTITLSVASGAANTFSMNVWYDGVSKVASEQAKVTLSIKGQGKLDANKIGLSAGMTVMIDSGKVYMQISSFALSSANATDADTMLVNSMIQQNLLGKWILFSAGDMSTSRANTLLTSAGADPKAFLNQLFAILRSSDSYVIEAWQPGGKYAFSFYKNIIQKIGALFNVPVTSADLEGFNLHGSINTDIAHPQLDMVNSWLDKTTKINSTWTKDSLVFHVTDMLLHKNMTLTIAKKTNGFGLSYKDDKKTTFDMSYLLNSTYTQIMRVRALLDGGITLRLSVSGKYYDAGTLNLVLPTQNVVPFESIIGSLSE